MFLGLTADVKITRALKDIPNFFVFMQMPAGRKHIKVRIRQEWGYQLVEEHLELRFVLVAETFLGDVQAVSILIFSILCNAIDLRLPIICWDRPAEETKLLQFIDGHWSLGLIRMGQALLGILGKGLLIEPDWKLNELKNLS